MFFLLTSGWCCRTGFILNIYSYFMILSCSSSGCLLPFWHPLFKDII